MIKAIAVSNVLSHVHVYVNILEPLFFPFYFMFFIDFAYSNTHESNIMLNRRKLIQRTNTYFQWWLLDESDAHQINYKRNIVNESQYLAGCVHVLLRALKGVEYIILLSTSSLCTWDISINDNRDYKRDGNDFDFTVILVIISNRNADDFVY